MEAMSEQERYEQGCLGRDALAVIRDAARCLIAGVAGKIGEAQYEFDEE